MVAFPLGRTMALAGAAAVVLPIMLAGCSGGESSAPAPSVAVAVASPSRQAGIFTKSTNVCLYNDSQTDVTVNWDFSDTNGGGGTLAPGGKQCGEGTVIVPTPDVIWTLSWADGTKWKMAASNISFESPAVERLYSKSMTSVDWIPFPDEPSQPNTKDFAIFHHQLEVTRQRDNDWKNFDIRIKG